MSDAPDIADRVKAGTFPADPATETTAVRPMIAKRGERDPALAAERALVASILWSGKYEPVAHRAKLVDTVVEPKMFRTQALGVLFAAAVALETLGSPTEPVAVASEARRAGATVDAAEAERLVGEATAPTPEKLLGWARVIRTGWVWRELAEVQRKTLADTMGQVGSPDEVMVRIREEVERLSGTTSSTQHTISALEATRSFAKAINGQARPFQTGFSAIDDATAGLRPRETSILAARTSVGKSSLAAQIARNMVTLRPDCACLYVSLEMSAMSFVARLIAEAAGIHASKMRRVWTLTSYDQQLYAASAEAFTKLEMHFVDSTSQTLVSIQSAARELGAALRARGKRLAMIVIDHIGLVKPSSELLKRANKEQQVAETSRGLRFLAETFDCHVMALAQIGREAEKNRRFGDMPRLHHLRDSDTIANDADTTFILHREREEKTGMFTDDKPPALAIAKARHDATAVLLLSFEPRFVRFANYAGDLTFWDYYGRSK